MNTLNRFLIGVLIVLVVVLGGVVLWQRSNSRPHTPALTATPSTQPVSPSQTQSSPEARQTLQDGLDLKAIKQWVDAREALRQWLTDNPKSDLVSDAEKALGEIDIQIVMTPVPAPEKVDYTIRKGDSLALIAKRHNTTIELIQKANHVSGSVIRPGDRLRIYQGKFSVIINKSDNRLLLLDNGKFFKRYRCGTGQYGLTPIGDFKIVDRIPNPPWWKDGKVIPFGDTNNVLGTHWLKLDVPGYGIHGTWEPGSIGTQSSAGCVRLLNDEITELFTLLPYGTPVTIDE